MPQPSWKVNEIFYSIQGEGRHTGMPAVFLRLSGCSMNCSFCDTKYAFGAGKEMGADALLNDLAQYPVKTVIITGGEPTEQDLPALIALLKSTATPYTWKQTAHATATSAKRISCAYRPKNTSVRKC